MSQLTPRSHRSHRSQRVRNRAELVLVPMSLGMRFLTAKTFAMCRRRQAIGPAHARNRPEAVGLVLRNDRTLSALVTGQGPERTFGPARWSRLGRNGRTVSFVLRRCEEARRESEHHRKVEPRSDLTPRRSAHGGQSRRGRCRRCLDRPRDLVSGGARLRSSWLPKPPDPAAPAERHRGQPRRRQRQQPWYP